MKRAPPANKKRRNTKSRKSIIRDKDKDIHLNVVGVPAGNVNVKRTPQKEDDEDYNLYKISIDTKNRETKRINPSETLQSALQKPGGKKPPSTFESDTSSSESDSDRSPLSTNRVKGNRDSDRLYSSRPKRIEEPSDMPSTSRTKGSTKPDTGTCFTIPGDNDRKIRIVGKTPPPTQPSLANRDSGKNKKALRKQVGFADVDAVYGSPTGSSVDSDDDISFEKTSPYKSNIPQVYYVQDLKKPNPSNNESIKIKLLPELVDGENTPKEVVVPPQKSDASPKNKQPSSDDNGKESSAMSAPGKVEDKTQIDTREGRPSFFPVKSGRVLYQINKNNVSPASSHDTGQARPQPDSIISDRKTRPPEHYSTNNVNVQEHKPQEKENAQSPSDNKNNKPVHYYDLHPKVGDERYPPTYKQTASTSSKVPDDVLTEEVPTPKTSKISVHQQSVGAYTTPVVSNTDKVTSHSNTQKTSPQSLQPGYNNETNTSNNEQKTSPYGETPSKTNERGRLSQDDPVPNSYILPAKTNPRGNLYVKPGIQTQSREHKPQEIAQPTLPNVVQNKQKPTMVDEAIMTEKPLDPKKSSIPKDKRKSSRQLFSAPSSPSKISKQKLEDSTKSLSKPNKSSLVSSIPKPSFFSRRPSANVEKHENRAALKHKESPRSSKVLSSLGTNKGNSSKTEPNSSRLPTRHDVHTGSSNIGTSTTELRTSPFHSDLKLHPQPNYAKSSLTDEASTQYMSQPNGTNAIPNAAVSLQTSNIPTVFFDPETSTGKNTEPFNLSKANDYIGNVQQVYPLRSTSKERKQPENLKKTQEADLASPSKRGMSTMTSGTYNEANIGQSSSYPHSKKFLPVGSIDNSSVEISNRTYGEHPSQGEDIDNQEYLRSQNSSTSSLHFNKMPIDERINAAKVNEVDEEMPPSFYGQLDTFLNNLEPKGNQGTKSNDKYGSPQNGISSNSLESKKSSRTEGSMPNVEKDRRISIPTIHEEELEDARELPFHTTSTHPDYGKESDRLENKPESTILDWKKGQPQLEDQRSIPGRASKYSDEPEVADHNKKESAGKLLGKHILAYPGQVDDKTPFKYDHMPYPADQAVKNSVNDNKRSEDYHPETHQQFRPAHPSAFDYAKPQEHRKSYSRPNKLVPIKETNHPDSANESQATNFVDQKQIDRNSINAGPNNRPVNLEKDQDSVDSTEAANLNLRSERSKSVDIDHIIPLSGNHKKKDRKEERNKSRKRNKHPSRNQDIKEAAIPEVRELPFGVGVPEKIVYVGRVPNTTYNVFFAPETVKNNTSDQQNEEAREPNLRERIDRSVRKGSKKVSTETNIKPITNGPKGILMFVNKKTIINRNPFDGEHEFEDPIGRRSRRDSPSSINKISSLLNSEEGSPASVSQPRSSKSINSKSSSRVSIVSNGEGDRRTLVVKSPSGTKITKTYSCGCIRIITLDPDTREVSREEIVAAYCKDGSKCGISHPKFQRGNLKISLDPTFKKMSTVSLPIRKSLDNQCFPDLEIVADGVFSRKPIPHKPPAPTMRGANFAGSLTIRSNKFNGVCNLYLDPRVKRYLRNNMGQVEALLEDHPNFRLSRASR